MANSDAGWLHCDVCGSSREPLRWCEEQRLVCRECLRRMQDEDAKEKSDGCEPA